MTSTYAALLAGLMTAVSGMTFGQTITYIPGSTKKLEQIIGDCDWATYRKGVTCLPTASQTLTKANVLGNGLGYSFPYGTLATVFLFGDTIGAGTQYKKWLNNSPIDTFAYNARDTFGFSRTATGEEPLQLTFMLGKDQTDKNNDQALLVQPAYPSGAPYGAGSLPMGAFDIPNSGILLGNQFYIVVSTGGNSNPGVEPGAPDGDKGSEKETQQNEYSVLVLYDQNYSFTAGRTISQANQGGHFVIVSLHEGPAPPGLGITEPVVYMFGGGEFRETDIYLAFVPVSEFATGLDRRSLPATRYFAGPNSTCSPGVLWSSKEACAVPIVKDNPLHTGVYSPSVGNLSVTVKNGLWLMTYDGGRNGGDPATNGIYFTYATNPWGQWATPQLIFNACRDDHAFGTYVYYSDPTNTICPGLTSPSGPAGPMIGPKAANPTQIGGAFAPEMIELFTTVANGTLTIYYTLSTWNPYTVVKMRSQFAVK